MGLRTVRDRTARVSTLRCRTEASPVSQTSPRLCRSANARCTQRRHQDGIVDRLRGARREEARRCLARSGKTVQSCPRRRQEPAERRAGEGDTSWLHASAGPGAAQFQVTALKFLPSCVNRSPSASPIPECDALPARPAGSSIARGRMALGWFACGTRARHESGLPPAP